MTTDRVDGFASFIESLDMRGSFKVQEVPSKNPHKSCKKKLIFPSMNVTTDDAINDDYDSSTPLPSETSLDSQFHKIDVLVCTETRKRPLSISSPEVNAVNPTNNYETPRKRIRFQEFKCETCNNIFYSQSELSDHKFSCVLDLLYERSNLPEESFIENHL